MFNILGVVGQFLATATSSTVMTEDLIILGTATSWLSNIIRSLFLFLDTFIYKIIPDLYNLGLLLADVRDALNQEALAAKIGDGLYIFFALAMFFRYAFAILTMIADPDKIEDKQKGLSKIVMNSIIAIILVVAVPTVFDIAYEVQRIMIGEPGGKGGLLYEAFARGGFDSGISAKDDGTRLAKSVFNFFIYGPVNSYNGGKWDLIDDAYNAYVDDPVFNITQFGEVITEQADKKYAIAYLCPISTIVGAYIAFSLLMSTIEIALRSVKLFALQIISPIAVISYIDPDSATKGIFKRWVDECLRTYLSLFFRLTVIFLFTTIIVNIQYDKLIQLNFWAVVFFILGLLSFVKAAPKMFESIFGYKAGDKTWGSEIVKKGLSFGGHLAAGAVGAGVGLGIGALTGGISSARHGLGFKAGAKVGAAAGLKTGAKTGYSAKNLGGFTKAAFAGMAGRKASQKAYGYKSSLPFTEGAEERSRYKTELAIAEAEYAEYKKAYEGAEIEALDPATRKVLKDANGNVITSSRKYAMDTMKDMYAKGVSDFRADDVETLRKSYAKGEAYKSMFKGQYGEALADLARAKAQKQVFERSMRRVQQAAAMATDPDQQARLKEQYEKLVSAEDFYNSKYNSAEGRLKEFDKNPAFAKESAKYARLDRADKLPRGENEKANLKALENWADDVKDLKEFKSSSGTDSEDIDIFDFEKM